jgi:hypothetical protein
MGNIANSTDQVEEDKNETAVVHRRMIARSRGSVRTENKSPYGDSSCGILTVIEHIFRRSDP